MNFVTSRPWIIALLAVILIGASAYVLLADKKYEFRFSEEALRKKLDERLPWTRRYLFVFDVTLENPRIDLIEDSDRIAGGVDVALNVYLNENPVPLGGAADVSGGVRYEPNEGAFYLTDPVIENIRIRGIPEAYSNKANQAISMALGDFYGSRPIFKLTGTDAGKVAARLLLKDVIVEDEHLIVTLGLRKHRTVTDEEGERRETTR